MLGKRIWNLCDFKLALIETLALSVVKGIGLKDIQ